MCIPAYVQDTDENENKLLNVHWQGGVKSYINYISIKYLSDIHIVEYSLKLYFSNIFVTV